MSDTETTKAKRAVHPALADLEHMHQLVKRILRVIGSEPLNVQEAALRRILACIAPEGS